MSTEKKSHISCPQCKHEFVVQEVLEKSVREELSNEYNSKWKDNKDKLVTTLKQELSNEWEEKIKQLESSNTLLSSQAKEFNDKASALELKEKELATAKELALSLQKEKEKELSDREAAVEKTISARLNSEIQKTREKLDSELREKYEADLKQKDLEITSIKITLETSIHQKYNQQFEELQISNQLRYEELAKRHNDTNKLVEELQRKADQGSMQLQGEVAEIYIEQTLVATFPQDEIRPVAKGLNGADSIQIVFNENRLRCGSIIYESKRTKHFAYEWIDKLKADMRSANCEVPILVTQAFPKELTRFGMLEGIWICTFQELPSVTHLIRSQMIRAAELINAQQDKESKMNNLYNYLIGPQFSSSIEAIAEAFTSMKASLEKEKKVAHKLWAEREKQIEVVMLSTTSMYGSIKGISGQVIPDVKALEHELDDEQGSLFLN